MAVTANEIRAALDALGGTADEVAATLRAKGCKGYPSDPCNCPVAVYLDGHFDKRLAAVVKPSRVWMEGVVAETPQPVETFVLCFDDDANDRYSDLIAEAR